MLREAPRTLYTLSREYQLNVDEIDYTVHAIDNGSSEPLTQELVESFGSEFRYTYFKAKTASPAEALNYGIDQAQSEYLMMMIDGARMVSPGLISKTIQAFQSFENPLVYTLSLHLGSKLQNDAILEGYNKDYEDKLLSSVEWKSNGYQLFKISDYHSSNHSFLRNVPESNCFALSISSLNKYGKFKTEFVTSGGGLVNLEIFERYINNEEIIPVSLIGEASFHQLHGGVSTNVTRKEHPISTYRDEYAQLFGKQYHPPSYQPSFWGSFPPDLNEIMLHNKLFASIELIRDLIKSQNWESANNIMSYITNLYPNNIPVKVIKARLLFKSGNYSEAKDIYEEILTDNPSPYPGIYIAVGKAYEKLNDFDKAIMFYTKSMKISPQFVNVYFHLAKLEQTRGNMNLALKWYKLRLSKKPITENIRFSCEKQIAELSN